MDKDTEFERMRLSACGVAAICNTREAADKGRIGPDNPYWSASYQDVCQAVDREMKYREALERIVKKVPEKVSREEAADMAVEFKLLAQQALT